MVRGCCEEEPGGGVEMHLCYDIILHVLHRNHFSEITRTIEIKMMHSLGILYVLIHAPRNGTAHGL